MSNDPIQHVDFMVLASTLDAAIHPRAELTFMRPEDSFIDKRAPYVYVVEPDAYVPGGKHTWNAALWEFRVYGYDLNGVELGAHESRLLIEGVTRKQAIVAAMEAGFTVLRGIDLT